MLARTVTNIITGSKSSILTIYNFPECDIKQSVFILLNVFWMISSIYLKDLQFTTFFNVYIEEKYGLF